MRLRSDQLGIYAENLVANKLIGAGKIVLAQRFRIRGGEIDIIAKEPRSMVCHIIEVKGRSNSAEISELISNHKYSSIIKTFHIWNRKHMYTMGEVYLAHVFPAEAGNGLESFVVKWYTFGV